MTGGEPAPAQVSARRRPPMSIICGTAIPGTGAVPAGAVRVFSLMAGPFRDVELPAFGRTLLQTELHRYVHLPYVYAWSISNPIGASIGPSWRSFVPAASRQPRG